MKKCTKCKIEKKLSEFHKNKNTKDGLQFCCKVCRKEQEKTDKEKISIRGKRYYQENKEYVKTKAEEWRINNKSRYRDYKKKYQKHKKETDPLFKMKHNLRTRNYYAFKNKGYSKNSKTQKMLGVDWEICKAHIENQFTEGMNWNNYGEWHIDHVIPLASANTEEELKKLCHYSNLQPLWAEDNIKKSNKIEE